MTTSADITAALNAISSAETTVSNAINTLINAIVDQNAIVGSHKLNPSIIPQLVAAQVTINQVAATIAAIGAQSVVV